MVTTSEDSKVWYCVIKGRIMNYHCECMMKFSSGCFVGQSRPVDMMARDASAMT